MLKPLKKRVQRYAYLNQISKSSATFFQQLFGQLIPKPAANQKSFGYDEKLYQASGCLVGKPADGKNKIFNAGRRFTLPLSTDTVLRRSFFLSF
jgi:hypothetical protein